MKILKLETEVVSMLRLSVDFPDITLALGSMLTFPTPPTPLHYMRALLCSDYSTNLRNPVGGN